DSDSPLLQVGAEGANHALTFHLPFVAAARREREDGPAVIAVNSDAHVAIETGRVPTLMVTMHAVRGYRVEARPQAQKDELKSKDLGGRKSQRKDDQQRRAACAMRPYLQTLSWGRVW